MFIANYKSVFITKAVTVHISLQISINIKGITFNFCIHIIILNIVYKNTILF